MASVKQHFDLPATPEQVWTALIDFGSWRNWMVGHVGLPDGPPSPVATSTSFKETIEVMGMKNEVNWTITACQAPRRLTLEGRGPMGSKLKSVYELQPVADGTRVQVENGVGGPAVAAMAGVLAKEAGKSMAASLERLKTILA